MANRKRLDQPLACAAIHQGVLLLLLEHSSETAGLEVRVSHLEVPPLATSELEIRGTLGDDSRETVMFRDTDAHTVSSWRGR